MSDVAALNVAEEILAEVDSSRRRFSSYGAYRSSESPLAARLPQHWVAKKGKYAITLTTSKGGNEGRKIGLEHIDSFTGKLLDIAAEYDGEGVAFQPNDILYGKLRPYLAKVHLAEFSGLAVGDFFVLRPRPEMEPRFVQYALLERAFTNLANGSTYGAKMPRVDWRFLGDLKFAIPPHDEQQAIARFLDRETAKIDSLVAKKRRLIELLGEKRTALISHAVTKGLNPDAPMKPSGIDWLGDVPAHWDVMPLRRILKRIEQGWSPECESRQAGDDEWAVMKAGCVNYGRFDEMDHKALPKNLTPDLSLEIKPGDLLMSRACGTAELVGSVAYVSNCREKLLLCDKLFRLRAKENRCVHQFLNLFLNSRSAREQIEQKISGADGLANNITQRTVREIVLPVPPISEQFAIREKVDLDIAAVERLIDSILVVIERLIEYRSALISAAVTGQIDVRKEVV